MPTARVKTSVLIFAALAVMAPVWAQTPEEIEKITRAMPEKPAIKPAEDRKVLVYSQALKFRHESIPYGEKAFQIMGQKTGAFSADLSSDPADLSAANLEKYDAIIFNNPTGSFAADPAVREALLNFVRNGKGIVGIHSATDANFDWAEYGEMIGGYFDGHPWTANTEVTLKVEQPKHPVNSAFTDTAFEVTDEIYQMMEPYSRDQVLVLVSLDTDKTDMNKKGIKRTDNDFPISWVQDYGSGRVFYTSLGHNPHIFWNETVLKHYLDGIQYALGDLDAAAAPQPAAAGGTEVSAEELEKALTELDQFDYGKDRAFILVIDEAIRQTSGKEERRDKLAKALTDRALNDDITYAARELAMDRLGEIGSGKNIDQLEKLFTHEDDKIAEVARQTIASIPAERSDKALIKALKSTKGKVREGVIHSLGERRTREAVKPLTEIARMGDATAASAAMLALGDIGNGEAARALLDDIRPPDAVREVWFMAMNDAGASLANDNKKLAGRLFDRVMQLGEKSPARLAAFKGKALLEANPEAMALKALDEGDPAVTQVARELLVRGNDPAITTQLIQRLESAKPDMKLTVLEILGARGDKAALAAVTELAAKSSPGNTPIQATALSALETLGDEESVPLLVKVAAEGKGQVREAAEATLQEMPVPEAGTKILNLIKEAAEPQEKVVAIETTVVRKPEGAVDVLVTAASDQDSKVAIAALKAIGELATYKDLARVLEIQAATTEEKVLREGGRTVLAVAKNYKKPEDAVKQVASTFQAAENPQVKASLLGVLSSLGGPNSLKIIRESLASDNEELKDAAVRALADFPTSAAMDDLLKIASDGDSQVHKVLALRGVARLLAEPSEKTTAERLEIAKRALEMAGGAEEKKTVIGALADLKEPGVLPLILAHLENPELKDESAAAILRHAPIANAFDPGNTAELLSPMNDKLNTEQWNKLEEALTPTDDDGGAIRAYHGSVIYKDDTIKSLGEVISHPFPPESGEVEFPNAVWAGHDDKDDKGMVDLAIQYPDVKNGVVYLRTHVWSPEDRKARLDTGSDDGMRAWVNGEQVFASDGPRGFTWWEDKTVIDLKRGWNTVLLKIGQGGGGYAVAGRIVDEAGKPYTDMKYSALPQGE